MDSLHQMQKGLFDKVCTYMHNEDEASQIQLLICLKGKRYEKTISGVVAHILFDFDCVWWSG